MNTSILAKHEKARAIAENTMSVAVRVTEVLKGFPKTSKRKRNIFTKSYNRRPMNKRKISRLLAKIAVELYTGGIQTAIAMSRPVPKFKSGTL